MGAFFLQLKNKCSDKIKIAEEVFNKKGLVLNKKIEHQNFTLLVYYKKYLKNENIFESDNGDFIAATGTLIYNGHKEKEALKDLFNDFSLEKPFFEGNLHGNFSFIIYKNTELYFMQDGLGYYPAYCNNEMSMVSSSFMAVTKCADNKEISVQELYEYVLNGQYISCQTLIKNIEFTDHKVIWKLYPNKRQIARMPSRKYNIGASCSENLEESKAILNEVFSSIVKAFGRDITSALSGGYDTRMILSIFRYLDVTPELYVYGKSSSTDVKIAMAIAEGEKLKLDHIDKSKLSTRKTPEDYYEFLKEQFYLYDGSGAPGVFDEGTDMITRKMRILKENTSLLHINGAGGEIYREIWSVWNKKLSINDLIKIRFDLFDFSMCGEKFDKNKYFFDLKEKMKEIIGIERDHLTRLELEKIFPLVRNRFAVINCSINNQFSYSLLPYMEKDIVDQSYTIPVKFKEHGYFQNELMKFYDPAISKYSSQYGVNFFDKVSVKKKLADNFRKLVPIALIPFLKNRKRKLVPPYYMEKHYLNEIFGASELTLKEYFDFKMFNDKDMLSRALTTEILLRDIF